MSKKGDKHYTGEEVAFLRDNFHTMSYLEMSVRLNKTVASVASKARRTGLTSGRRKGPLNGNWKGGRSLLRSGYIRDNVAGRNVHSLVMEGHLGRPLTAQEMVHHIDGDKANNSVTNLALCRDASHHRHMHASLERVAFELVRRGDIRFNRETGEYSPKGEDV